MKKWNLNRNLSLLPNIVTSNLLLLVYILLQIYIFISILYTYLYFNTKIFRKYKKNFFINFGNYHLHCKSFLRHVDTKRRIRWYPGVDRVDMCFPSP